MNFKCQALSITDDPDFGCTIQFSDTADHGFNENQSIDEIVNSNEKYFLLQRSYPEDFDEDDYYSIETSESEVELGYLDKIIIELSKERIKIRWSWVQVEIGLSLQENEFAKLERILKRRFKEKIIMLRN